jgi:hypothetical protein
MIREAVFQCSCSLGVISVDIAVSARASAIHHTGHYHGGNESADQGLGSTAR